MYDFETALVDCCPCFYLGVKNTSRVYRTLFIFYFWNAELINMLSWLIAWWFGVQLFEIVFIFGIRSGLRSGHAIMPLGIFHVFFFFLIFVQICF